VPPGFEASIGPVPVKASIDFAVNMVELGGGYTVAATSMMRNSRDPSLA
jgi:hypothetical protein